MPYLASININTTRQHPFPFDVPAIKFAKDIDLSNNITFLVGENGTGKSTLLESIACKLNLPHMEGFGYDKNSFSAARTLEPFLHFTWGMERFAGFFFRAEDFGDYLNSIHRKGTTIEQQMGDMGEDVPRHIVEQMKNSANTQLRNMRQTYGQELQAFSHGEAYLHIMDQRINKRGIYLLDEPEAALSPARQLTLIHFIQNHLKHYNSQFIVATHSPMLLAYPEAAIYEISDNHMAKTDLQNTDHYSITKSFLDNPEAFLRHL